MCYIDTMTKRANHAEIADRLRHHSPHWVTIDTASDRGAIAGRAAAWRNPARQPAAFRGGGFEFRTHKAHEGRGGFWLEGRYIGAGPAPY